MQHHSQWEQVGQELADRPKALLQWAEHHGVWLAGGSRFLTSTRSSGTAGPALPGRLALLPPLLLLRLRLLTMAAGCGPHSLRTKHNLSRCCLLFPRFPVGLSCTILCEQHQLT